jgi:hypothetical protein
MPVKLWTQSKIEYFKANYYTKTNVQMSAILGVSYNSLRYKARALGMADKRKLGLSKGIPKGKYTRKAIPNEVMNYGPSPDTRLEAEGRKNIFNIQDIKDNLCKGKKIKLLCRKTGKAGRPVIRHFKGKVLDKTDFFIVVKGKNYTECFKYSDILIGKTILEEA